MAQANKSLNPASTLYHHAAVSREVNALWRCFLLCVGFKKNDDFFNSQTL